MPYQLDTSTEKLLQELVASGDFASPDEALHAAVKTFYQQRTLLGRELNKGLEQIQQKQTVHLDWNRLNTRVRQRASNKDFTYRSNSGALPFSETN